MNFTTLSKILLFQWLCTVLWSGLACATTYYVSSSAGNDAYDGLSENSPLATINKVNSLSLSAGDNIFFKCGDTWRAEMLVLQHSGTTGSPITYGSYPQGCDNKPVLSGSQPITGWQLYSTNIYVADLDSGANNGKFPYGLNQLFRNSIRLPLGRWPNLDEDDDGVHFHRGYSKIEAQQSGTSITDNQLPVADWTGGTVHIKGMRWYILNRDIAADSGSTLTFSTTLDCWGGSCTGWGYFINNHLAALDRIDEWSYDEGTNRVYLYSTNGSPVDGTIEGSAILTADDRAWGAIVLGRDYNEQIQHVVIENFSIINGYRNGITTPTNLKAYENSYLTIRNNDIINMDSTGIKLATWVYAAEDGRPNGWRGGYSQEIHDNVIDGANHFGIDSFARESLFQDNIIRNIGRIENVGKSGIGCGEGGGGTCTESGDGFRIKTGRASDTGHTNTLIGNRLTDIAYNGVDIFGHTNTLTNNVITRSCITKGDCGAVRTFGSNDLASTAVYDLVIEKNIIQDCEGNSDGARDDYRTPFGFGLYIDHYSKNVQTDGNTISGSTSHGILYQNSTGTATGNTLYNNANSADWGGQLWITSAPANVTSLHNNIFYGLRSTTRTLSAELGTLSNSDNNAFFHPYHPTNIYSSGYKTLAEWQNHSGMDGNSATNWFTLESGDPPLSKIFINDTDAEKTTSLGNIRYLNLDRATIQEYLTLAPYSSKILVYDSTIMPELSHCIGVLQVLSGLEQGVPLSLPLHDMNEDGKLGMGDVVAMLQSLSGS